MIVEAHSNDDPEEPAGLERAYTVPDATIQFRRDRGVGPSVVCGWRAERGMSRRQRGRMVVLDGILRSLSHRRTMMDQSSQRGLVLTSS